MSRKSQSERKRTKKHAAIAHPSDLVATGASPREGGSSPATTSAPAEERTIRPELPPVMQIKFEGGDRVRLLEEQEFADRDRVRKNEVGIALYPSSQAAAWVVHFPKKGSKTRVIPEHLLELVE